MMRALSIILLLIQLLLTLSPCVDKPHEHCGKPLELSTDKESAQDHDLDLCSPFCSCQCCQTTITLAQRLIISSFMSPSYTIQAPVRTLEEAYIPEFYIPPKA